MRMGTVGAAVGAVDDGCSSRRSTSEFPVTMPVQQHSACPAARPEAQVFRQADQAAGTVRYEAWIAGRRRCVVEMDPADDCPEVAVLMRHFYRHYAAPDAPALPTDLRLVR